MNKKTYKIIALSGVVCFPEMPVNCNIGRDLSKNAIKSAFENNEDIVVVTQLNKDIENNFWANVTHVGCIAKIKSSQPDRSNPGALKVLIEGKTRVKINSITYGKNYISGEVEEIVSYCEDKEEQNILISNLKEKFVELASSDRRYNSEIVRMIGGLNDADALVSSLTVMCIKDQDLQLKILEESDINKRLEMTIGGINKALDIVALNKAISERVKQGMDKNQKEYYLREQMKAISSELGEDENEFDEIEKKLENPAIPEETKEKALKELARLRKLPNTVPDYSILRNYLDVLLELPYGVKTEDNKDLKLAKEILDSEHSGLEKVKERILEHLAVMHLTDKVNSQIICFVGPPGVGKTSIAKSISKALNRNFVKMSVGGVKDESEIRGHRKTYVGAMPGRIIYNLKQAKSMNPVFLIDEIDKMSADYKGDPTSAMLEVLDPEQNTLFRDHYLEVSVDLSDIMFICTANDKSAIPAPLLDRMEIIELSSYTLSEKFDIAKTHLLPKQIKEHGLKDGELIISDDTLKQLIEEYTCEAGVRNLERTIGAVCRKIAVKILNCENRDNFKFEVNKNNLKELLGAHKLIRDEMRETAEVGVVSGLSYSTVGGGVLTIESNSTVGEGKIELTGQLGDVMKESAKAALSAIKSLAKDYNLDLETIKKQDIHIHVPEGAVKKDGPSAGCALATVIYSLFSGKKINNNLAMTGEITIRGNVLAIGGLKEKLFACTRAGITNVYVPYQNKDDVADLPKEITKKLNITYMKNIREILDNRATFVE